MRYLGGKARIAKLLSEFLKAAREDGQPYIEPFVGAGWVLQEMDGERYASDINPYLIAMYKALQQGWIPPDEIDEDFYKWAKDENGGCPDYLRGFIGFGCSFAGKWFGGYARHTGKFNYARVSMRSCLRQLPKIKQVCFECHRFDALDPVGAIIYCDPPYADTTTYSFAPKFDVDYFWGIMRYWSIQNTVFISEYSAPRDFSCILQIPTKTSIRDRTGNVIPRVEKLFTYTG